MRSLKYVVLARSEFCKRALLAVPSVELDARWLSDGTINQRAMKGVRRRMTGDALAYDILESLPCCLLSCSCCVQEKQGSSQPQPAASHGSNYC